MHQEEADTRIILHIIHALNCGFSSILIKTCDSYVIVILIHHLQHFDTISTGCNTTVNYGTGKTQRVINIRELACALGVQRSVDLPLFVTLTGYDSTSAMKGRSKRMIVFLCMEEVFAPRHRLHGGAAGQPIPTFADRCQVCCIRRAVHSDIWVMAGLIDQPSAENDILSEKL